MSYFTVLPVGSKPPKDVKECAFLITDNWNDWGKFKTQYLLIVYDKKGNMSRVGDVKIGEFGMTKDTPRAAIPDEFDALDEQFFSLGQEAEYYETLSGLGDKIRKKVLEGLRDIAADAELFERADQEYVTSESLMRSVRRVALLGQYRRLAQGLARLSKYKFKYTTPKPAEGAGEQLVLDFEVKPQSFPPSNIHVLIGRNGVGKTHLLNLMTRALVEKGSTPRYVGQFTDADDDDLTVAPFVNLVSVTFSAFDPFDPLPDRREKAEGMRYTYVGLKRTAAANAPKAPGGKQKAPPKTLEMLTNEFAQSVKDCVTSAKGARWRRALEALEADPIFEEAEIAALVDPDTDWDEVALEQELGEALVEQAKGLFARLSTGHKIVLLTITRLVEAVEEKTLILMDEPESHLHPPLLSAFVRCLSDLLMDRNGVAIIATHSPVILQEVPEDCVWKLRRTGAVLNADRPEINTFGEHVGVLTREVFGLEVVQSGFYKMLNDAVDELGDYDEIMSKFKDKLGSEARALIRSLLAAKKTK